MPRRHVNNFRMLYFIAIFMYKAGTTGLVYGFQAIAELMRYGGIYSHLCVESDDMLQDFITTAGGCKAQNDALKAAWEIGFQLQLLSGLVCGPLCDIAGPKITGFAGMMCSMFGILLWTFATTPETDFLVTVGWVFVGLSKQAVVLSCLSVSNLFPKRQGTALSIINGATDVGAFIPQILTYFFGIATYREFMFGYIGYLGFLVLLGLIVLPRNPFEKPTSSSEVKSQRLDQSADASADASSEKTALSPKDDGQEYSTVDLWRQPFTSQLLSVYFFIFVPYFCVSYWRVGFYTKTVDTFLKNIDPLAFMGHLTVFNTMLPFATLCAVIMGGITDVYGIHFQLVLLNSLGVALFALSTVPVLNIQLLSFVVYIFYKSNVIGSLMFYTLDTFGFTNFGKLVGIQLTICSGAYLGLTKATEYVERNVVPNETWLCVWVVAISLPLFLVPLYITLKRPYTKEIHQEIEKAGHETRVSVAVVPTTHVPSTQLLHSFNPARHTHVHADVDMFFGGGLVEEKGRFKASSLHV
eukprot:Selendium_serpulae@DN4737_c0_g1_i1.p1